MNSWWLSYSFSDRPIPLGILRSNCRAGYPKRGMLSYVSSCQHWKNPIHCGGRVFNGRMEEMRLNNQPNVKQTVGRFLSSISSVSLRFRLSFLCGSLSSLSAPSLPSNLFFVVSFASIILLPLWIWICEWRSITDLLAGDHFLRCNDLSSDLYC